MMVSESNVWNDNLFISDVIIAVGDGKTKRTRAELLSVNGNKWNKVDSYPFLVNGIYMQIWWLVELGTMLFMTVSLCSLLEADPRHLTMPWWLKNAAFRVGKWRVWHKRQSWRAINITPKYSLSLPTIVKTPTNLCHWNRMNKIRSLNYGSIW